MTSLRLAHGIYHNGQGEGYTFKYPNYSLFKIIPEEYDSVQTVLYSIVATYENGNQSNWIYTSEEERLAFETFDLMIDRQGC